MNIKIKDIILLEANRFEKEIKNLPFNKQIDWRRNKALNQMNTFSKGIDNGSYIGVSHLSPIMATTSSMPANGNSSLSTLKNYDRSGIFKNLSAIEAQGNVSKNKENEFLKDFKNADRAREQQLHAQSNAYNDLSKDYKFRKTHMENIKLFKNAELSNQPNNGTDNNKINIYSGGGYHNFNNFLDNGKKSSKLLWVAPEGSSLLNDPSNKTFYANKALDIGDVPATLSAQIKTKDLVNSGHINNITNKDEALVIKNTKLYNPVIEKLASNSSPENIYRPRNNGIKSAIHFDNNKMKYI